MDITLGLGPMVQDSWDMAANQMMQLTQMRLERERYEENLRRYGQEQAHKLLMDRQDLSMKQKQAILNEAGAKSELATGFQGRTQAAAANRQAMKDRLSNDKMQEALSAGILRGMVSGGTNGASGKSGSVKLAQGSGNTDLFARG